MSRYQRQRLVWLACVLGGFLICSLLVLRGMAAGQASVQPGQEHPVQVPDEILETPRRYLHQSVAVEGEIARVLSDRVITLRSRSVRKGLLVVLSDEACDPGLRLTEGQPVRVEGIVRTLHRPEVSALEERYGLGVSRQSLLASFGSHPYVLAYEVRPGTSEVR
ncbi:MAG: hypothetical protein QME94_02245 [Anaerolineae bacterium]|nr:hypothetical protein [Anaerolineae bacterium]